MSKKAIKPNQIRLNLNQKVEILKKSDGGVSGKRLALDFNVSEAAISKIKKKRSDILGAVSNTLESANKKTLHKPEFSDLEDKVYEWFLTQRQRNCPVSGPMLKARAKVEFEKLHPGKSGSFSASNGWLSNFKKRHGIRHLKICGEILSNDTTQITPFIHQLRAVVNEMGITDAQLYNADESGLYYHLLPDRTFVAASEKTAPGRKVRKERITFLLCANADGTHKMQPLVIGKSANPRCFKGFKNPLEYANSKKAWMNSQLFYNWFHGSFIKQVCFLLLDKIGVCLLYFDSIFLVFEQVRKFSAENNLPPKALLLIDNCTAHKPIELLKSDDGKIVAMFLPPNATAIVQPMDQNPIRLVKLAYRTKLLCSIIAQENIPLEDALKAHSLRDAILLLKLVWDELPQSVLVKAWKKIKNWDDSEYDEEDNVPLSELIQTNDLTSTLKDVQLLLSKVGLGTELSIDEIEKWNEDETTEEDEDGEIDDNESEEETVPETPKVTYTEAIESANTLIKWYEKNNNVSQVANLLEMRANIVKDYINKDKKQVNLTSYFKPIDKN
jgi:DDE superfamily endonuclease/Tc5 transposase DNA-binding domain/CENP-B N-terminal DNA-binding domain